MIICFDTSGLNRLMDDPQNGKLIRILQHNFTVYITAINVVELLNTKCLNRRKQLISLARQLTQKRHPLDLPDQLFQSVCQSFNQREENVTISRLLWWEILESNEVSSLERQKIRQLTDEYKQSYMEIKTILRQKIDCIFVTAPGEKPIKLTHYLRLYMEMPPHVRSRCFKWLPLYGVTATMYKHVTGDVLPLSSLDSFLLMKPSIWPLFLAAEAFSIYYGAIWDKKSGRRNAAGKLDLQSAVYLPFCDIFVTHDIKNGGQFSALRFLNVFNRRVNWNNYHQQTRIQRWSEFRTFLLSM